MNLIQPNHPLFVIIFLGVWYDPQPTYWGYPPLPPFHPHSISTYLVGAETNTHPTQLSQLSLTMEYKLSAQLSGHDSDVSETPSPAPALLESSIY